MPPQDRQDSFDNDSNVSSDARRTKRARYAVRACSECQSRKIRCQGGYPCAQCTQKGRRCIVSDDAPKAPGESLIASEHSFPAPTARGLTRPVKASKQRVTTNDVLQRLLGVERRLEAAFSQNCIHSEDDRHSDRDDQPVVPETPASAEHEVDEGQTFLAEPAIEESEPGCGEDHGLDPNPVLAAVGSRHGHLTPKPSPRSRKDAKPGDGSAYWLPDILDQNGVDRTTLDGQTLLQVYLDEIHILYPFLHPPSVWQTSRFVCERHMDVSCKDLESHGESRTSLAIFFVCIALGRCTVSTRLTKFDGAHSAGWSLYSVAMDLVRPLLDVSTSTPIYLQSLQVMTLMVIYLIRLDACEKASRILAHLVSSAYIHGLHRSTFYSGLSAFQDEMSTRLWWSVHAIDRRISFESGRPFLILDGITELRPPLPVSDAWLTHQKHSNLSLNQLQSEVEKDMSLLQPNFVTFLECWMQQYRIATEISKAIHEAEEGQMKASPAVCEYLDVFLDHWWQSLPTALKYREYLSYHTQFQEVALWQRKQCVILYLRYHLLKLLIRRVGATGQRTWSSISRQQILASDVQCAQRAAKIIQSLNEVPLEVPRYSFTTIHTLTNATIILLGIVRRQPSLRPMHADSLQSALGALFSYCQSTWVSGKMIRTVTKLDHIIQNTLRNATAARPDVNHDTADEASWTQTAASHPDRERSTTTTTTLSALHPSERDPFKHHAPSQSSATANLLSPASTEMREAAQVALLPTPDVQQDSHAAAGAAPPLQPLPDVAAFDLDFERAFSTGAGDGGTLLDVGDAWKFNLDHGWF